MYNKMYHKIDNMLKQKPMYLYEIINSNHNDEITFVLSNVNKHVLYAIVHDRFNLPWYNHTTEVPSYLMNKAQGFYIHSWGLLGSATKESIHQSNSNIYLDSRLLEENRLQVDINKIEKQENIWLNLRDKDFDNLAPNYLYVIDFDYKTEHYTLTQLLDEHDDFDKFLKEMSDNWNKQFSKTYKTIVVTEIINNVLSDLSEKDKEIVLSSIK